MKRDDLYTTVTQSLGACQLVEEALKLYFREALWLAEKENESASSQEIFNKDYDNYALGALIGPFRNRSGNGSLADALEEFTKQRNFLAHQAVAHCLDPDVALDESAEEIAVKSRLIHERAVILCKALHKELNNARSRLCLDDFDETQDG